MHDFTSEKLFSELVCLSMSGPVGIVGFLQ